VILLVDSLYAEAIEAVKWHAPSSSSIAELILILGDIKFEASLWNRSQSVNLFEWFLEFFGSNVIQDVGYYCNTILKVFRYMSQAMWPLSGVTSPVVQKQLCSFGLFPVQSHVCACVSLSDRPLSLCCLCFTMLLRPNGHSSFHTTRVLTPHCVHTGWNT
jgi:hypothetical protein